jgi:hypothetical protein
MAIRHHAAWLVAVLLAWPPASTAQDADYEREPIDYLKAPVDDPVARLQACIDRGEVMLDRDPERGYLDAVLRALGVPASSQTLVFSRTSFQRDRIGVDRPRALYFGDDVYVGYVRGGDVVELAAADPRQGAVFYVLDQAGSGAPKFQRMTHECLSCHASGRTQGVPGHLVRSVYPDSRGNPIFNAGSYTTDDRSPFEQRWGGWYVTGTHGDRRHMGNVVVADPTKPEALDREPGANLTSLEGRVDTSAYPQPGSDLVALLVMEHQTQMHNALAWGGFEGRRALHYQAGVNKAFGEPDGTMLDSTRRRLDNAAARIVERLLFSGEAPLDGPVAGTSAFAADYQAKGPRDPAGRSLRDLDLNRRLLRHPCSPLIYSEAFLALPEPVLERVASRMSTVLDPHDRSAGFEHLSRDDRVAIREILEATHPRLRSLWAGEVPPAGG